MIELLSFFVDIYFGQNYFVVIVDFCGNSLRLLRSSFPFLFYPMKTSYCLSTGQIVDKWAIFKVVYIGVHFVMEPN